MTSNPNQAPKIIDRPDVADVYASRIIAITYDGGPIVVTLGALRMIPARLGEPVLPADTTIHVVQRIVLSQPAAAELVNMIQGLMNTVILGQSAPPSPGRAN